MAKVLKLEDRFTFGKYKGKKAEKIASKDPTYIAWVTWRTDWIVDARLYDLAREGYDGNENDFIPDGPDVGDENW